MVVRIHDAARWARFKAGKSMVLAGDRGRKVVLEVNCPEPTRFDLVIGGEDKIVFLASVHGLETIEFYADAPKVEVVPTTDADFWVFTSDGEETAFVSDAEQFTTILQRKATNPEVERLKYMMQLNEWRRDQKQAAEIAELRAMLAEQARAAGANTETGELPNEDGIPAAGGTGGAAPAAGAGAAPPVKDKGAAPDGAATS